MCAQMDRNYSYGDRSFRGIHSGELSVKCMVHIALLQPTHVRGTFQEPQQLIGKSLEKHRLRRV